MRLKVWKKHLRIVKRKDKLYKSRARWGHGINIQSKINKLIKALEVKGYIYLINKEQGIGQDSGRKYTIYKLYEYITVEEYEKRYPKNKRDLSEYEYVKDEVYKCFKPIDLLLKLVEIYKSVSGEVNR